MVSTADIASAAARELLRQLSIGLSVYRLFPGEIEHTGFVAAVERIRDAAQKALRSGTVHAEIRGGHQIVLEDGTTLGDEQAGRLALACYERGVEHLHVVGVPDAQDLATVYEALSQPEAEIAVYGGLDPALAARGVTTLRFGDVAPEPVDEVARSLERLSPEVRELWEQMEDPQLLAASLLAGESSTSPMVAARTVYARFKAIADALPDHLTSLPRFAGSLARSVRHMPGPVRRELTTLLIHKAATDVLAERAIGDLNDPEMVDLILDLAEEGADPIAVAREVVGVCARHRGLVDLTQSIIEARKGDSSSHPIVAAISLAADDSVAQQAVTDLATRRLMDAEQGDLEAIRAELAGIDSRALALAVFTDYVRNEEDRERLGQVLEVWVDHVRAALEAGDTVEVAGLVKAADDAFAQADEELREMLEVQRGRILHPPLVADFVQRSRDAVARDHAIAALGIFGGLAVDTLLDALAEEENRDRRAVLVAMITALADDHLDRVEKRLADERWYVVANAVTILGRVGNRPDAFTALERVTAHPEPGVRRRVASTLLPAGGRAALGPLRGLADDPDPGVRQAAVAALGGVAADEAARTLADLVRTGVHGDVCQQALAELGRHPASESAALLEGLAARSAKPRLPRRLRRQAARLVHARGTRR